MCNSNLTENLSFTCERFIRGQVFYFSVDENDDLIKLGDGTYGIVYEVQTEQGDKFAVKLFYEQKKETETETEKYSLWLKKSFEQELDLIREIMKRSR